MEFAKNLIILKPISREAGKKLIEKYHYSHGIPANSKIFLGVYYNKILNGVCIYANPSGTNVLNLVNNTKNGECLELIRLALSPEMPKNSESRVIAISIKILKKNYKHLKWLISYADTEQKHLGVIYQATNWVYTGTGGGPRKYIINGKEYHNRTISQNRLKYNLKLKGNIQIVKCKPKHRYFYFLKPEEQKNLKLKVLTYPKNAPVV